MSDPVVVSNATGTTVPSRDQAGGGGISTSLHDAHITTFEPGVLDMLRRYYNRLGERKERLPEEQVRFAGKDFAEFLRYMGSRESNAITEAPAQNLDLPLSSYFISSSHNTYLMGHQLYGTSTVDGYKNVLLRGCRCVEIDCWNGDSHPNTPTNEQPPAAVGKKGEKLEPVVLHGYTATKEITFRSVCQTIRDYAFKTTDLPLIISLEVHTNHTQQQVMVDIMNEYFQDLLLQPIAEGDIDTPLPILSKIRNKILIKVKYTAPDKVEQPTAEDQPVVKVPTNSSSSSSSDEAEAKEKKPAKIIQSLSQMGLYTRSFHFSGLKQPEATVPTHIFSLSESSFTGLYKEDPEGLFNHNKAYMMRTYPKGTRISSSNLNPSVFWRAGVQMVALNWQKVDKGMMLQEAMFNGSGGWVQKPSTYQARSSFKDSRLHVARGGKSRLHISVLAAQNLPVPDDAEHAEKFKPFIKCEVHVDSADQAAQQKRLGRRSDSEAKFKQKIGAVKGQNPTYDKVFDFDNLPPLIPELSFVRFKVIHDDRFGRDDFAAWACIRLDRLAHGVRFIHLWDVKGAPTSAVLLVKIDYDWNAPT